jgi:CubicO group peptidase (beta-lactamase class C family)
MHRFAKLLIAMFAGLMVNSALAVGYIASAQTDLADRLLADMSRVTAVPAFSIAVMQNGQLLWQESVGLIDVDNKIAPDVESRFRIASVSKAVTATMLASLVDAGRLDVHATLSTYLDDLPASYRDVTVLQLITHTSGMPHYQPRDADIRDTHYSSALASVEAVGDRELLSTPGSAYSYSTHGYSLLGALYESITGVNFETGLNEFRSSFSGRATPAIEHVERPTQGRSQVYSLSSEGVSQPSRWDQSYSWAGASMEASAVDLAWWGNSVLHSRQISATTRTMMFTPFRFPDGTSPGTYMYSVAFGWRVGMDGFGRRVAHHAGVTQGARSVLVVYPDDGLSIALLSNARWTAQIERTAFGFANLFLAGAKPIQFGKNGRIYGKFEDESMYAELAATADAGTSQLLSDETGLLSTWLNRFDSLDREQEAWPFYKMKSTGGSSLIVVSTIGLINLQQVSSEAGVALYRGKLGKSRILELSLSR